MVSENKMNALIIFAKNPITEPVKTRLAKDIGKIEATELYKKMIKKIIEDTSSEDYDTIIYCQGNADYFNQYPVDTRHQDGENLGEKLFHAVSDELKAYKKVIIIGSDCPDISESEIKNAFKILEVEDVVLGKSVDGGYWLVGLKEPHNIFTLETWSHNQVYNQTINLIIEKKLTCQTLPEKRDIDSKEELEWYQQKGIL